MDNFDLIYHVPTAFYLSGLFCAPLSLHSRFLVNYFFKCSPSHSLAYQLYILLLST